MGSPDDFEAIKGLYKDANDLLGNIVKVTPTSKQSVICYLYVQEWPDKR